MVSAAPEWTRMRWSALPRPKSASAGGRSRVRPLVARPSLPRCRLRSRSTCADLGVDRCGLGGQRDLDADGDQALLHAVVEVLLDLAAFGIAGADEPRARLAERLHRA